MVRLQLPGESCVSERREYWCQSGVNQKFTHFDEARPVASVRQTLTVQSSPPVARQSSVGWKAIALTASRWLYIR